MAARCPQNGGDAWFGYCARCGTRGPYAYDQHNALALWNRRTPPAPPEQADVITAALIGNEG